MVAGYIVLRSSRHWVFGMNHNEIIELSDLIADDLNKFDLTTDDIDARRLSVEDHSIAGLTGTLNGYRIPYYNISGNPIRHARIKLLERPRGGASDKASHKLLSNGSGFISTNPTINYVYYPPNFNQTIQTSETSIVIITTDERRAASITKKGYPTTAITDPKGWMTTKGSGVAKGFNDLIDLALEQNRHILIWIGDGTDVKIQSSVAKLSLELLFRGVPLSHVRQYTFKEFDPNHLTNIMKPITLLPRFPSVRRYVEDRLNESSRTKRKEISQISMAILADLESHGHRIRNNETQEYYYFDHGTKEIMRIASPMDTGLARHNQFMSYLFNAYGIHSGDAKIIPALFANITSKQPIMEAKPHSIIDTTSRKDNFVNVQASKTQYIHISASGADVRWNGANGTLFSDDGYVGNSVDFDATKFTAAYNNTTAKNPKIIEPFWRDVLSQVNTPATRKQLDVLTTLYYMSPWLLGWNRIQLPLELVIGEPDSGKSSIFALRMQIIQGFQTLYNMQQKYQDWQAIIANGHGLTVIDNIHTMPKSLRQTTSDELCRITTEHNPHIHLRKYYTAADRLSIPITTTFGFTSITDIYTNPDFVSRSVVLKMAKSNDGDFHYDWVKDQFDRFGGREVWLAHHAAVLTLFFKEVQKQWLPTYRSLHRLINFEQSLVIMAQILGLDHHHMPKTVTEMSDSYVLETNNVLAGLTKFANTVRTKNRQKTHYKAIDIAELMSLDDEFHGYSTLTSPRKLGKFISTNKAVVQRIAGIKAVRKAGSNSYIVLRSHKELE